jgi:phosphatidylglycerophosphate synthase
VRRVHVGPATGLLAALALLLALTVTVGLNARAVTLGVATAVLTWVLLEHGMRAHRLDRLGPANRVTLARATLIAAITALVAQARFDTAPRSLLLGLTAVALALDGVDGRVARRTRSITALGAAFDMEADAYLILVLSWYVAAQVGWWVLAIGLARYLMLATRAVVPWLSGAVPTRLWAKVVAAVQGIVLTVVAADLLPGPVETAALLVALALLAESFGREAVVLWQQRRTVPGTRPWFSPTVEVVAVSVPRAGVGSQSALRSNRTTLLRRPCLPGKDPTGPGTERCP